MSSCKAADSSRSANEASAVSVAALALTIPPAQAATACLPAGITWSEGVGCRAASVTSAESAAMGSPTDGIDSGLSCGTVVLSSGRRPNGDAPVELSRLIGGLVVATASCLLSLSPAILEDRSSVEAWLLLGSTAMVVAVQLSCKPSEAELEELMGGRSCGVGVAACKGDDAAFGWSTSCPSAATGRGTTAALETPACRDGGLTPMLLTSLQPALPAWLDLSWQADGHAAGWLLLVPVGALSS